MRDNIYGPTFEGLNKILERVKSVQHYDLGMPENFEGVMTHYLFFKIEQNLRNKLSEILDRVEKYLSIRRATEVMLRDIIRKEIEKAYHIDIGTNENAPHLSLLVGKVHVAWISFMKTLLRSIEPREFLRTEKEKWGKAVLVEVSIGGKKGDLSDFESLYKVGLQEAEKESLYRKEKEQRTRLINEKHSWSRLKLLSMLSNACAKVGAE